MADLQQSKDIQDSQKQNENERQLQEDKQNNQQGENEQNIEQQEINNQSNEDENEEEEESEQVLNLNNFNETKKKRIILNSPRSLEACELHGIAPDQLIVKTRENIKNMFMQKGNILTPEALDMFEKNFESRRQNKLKELRQTYQEIIELQDNLHNQSRYSHMSRSNTKHEMRSTHGDKGFQKQKTTTSTVRPITQQQSTRPTTHQHQRSNHNLLETKNSVQQSQYKSIQVSQILSETAEMQVEKVRQQQKREIENMIFAELQNRQRILKQKQQEQQLQENLVQRQEMQEEKINYNNQKRQERQEKLLLVQQEQQERFQKQQLKSEDQEQRRLEREEFKYKQRQELYKRKEEEKIEKLQKAQIEMQKQAEQREHYLNKKLEVNAQRQEDRDQILEEIRQQRSQQIQEKKEYQQKKLETVQHNKQLEEENQRLV